MAKVIHGERIGKSGALTVGCSAVIFDSTKEKVLLTRRSDNGRWCIPGGHMEPGEGALETCIREVWEETGLDVRMGKLIGVYTNPHRIIEYSDGNRCQMVGLCFEAEPIGGEPRLSDETTAYGYFSLMEMESMDVMENHRERIADAFARQDTAFVR